ncbi:MAG: rcc01693 family protein [Paracoccaceae bacterium]
MADRIDWPHLMRLGLGVLRLSPDTFWTMTPIELLAALQGAGFVPIGGAMDRSALDTLMNAYPDSPTDKE